MKPHWSQSAENLCRDVAGCDLEGHAVYIVDWAEIESAEPRLHGGECLAWTSYALDVALESWLREHGRWAGQGFATIVRRERIATWREVLGCVLHELGHWLDDARTIQRPMVPDAELVLALRDWSDSRPGPTKETPPWFRHEAGFIRACCHLAQRTEDCMQSIRPSTMRFTRPYLGLSEDTFMTSLADELGTPGSIRNILATEPPEAFSRLWTSSTDWWEQ